MTEPSSPTQDDRLTVRIPTAMAMLGISRSRLYKLMSNGDIATIKAGRARLIVLRSLNEFVEGQADS
ncbi:MAG: helix-turn-helix domain-containing protein [Sphingomonadales bacterium]|nr:helix-turn-helix domain-containing protein [Sphingomonadales bacterium]MDE2570259.1 helix-turn-helix domain-containing protein [Sphingomonadales bacterium]